MLEVRKSPPRAGVARSVMTIGMHQEGAEVEIVLAEVKALLVGALLLGEASQRRRGRKDN